MTGASVASSAHPGKVCNGRHHPPNDVLLEHQLTKHRLVLTITAIDFHRLIVGIDASTSTDVLLTVKAGRIMAQSYAGGSWINTFSIKQLHLQSFANHKQGAENLRLLATRSFLQALLLNVRKFGIEGGHELIHVFIRRDGDASASSIVSDFSVLIPPNKYHWNPTKSWKRINPRPADQIPPQDTTLSNEPELPKSRLLVALPLHVFKYLPTGTNILNKTNFGDHWTFSNFSESGDIVEIRRGDWFRALSEHNMDTTKTDYYEDRFSPENRDDLTERAQDVLAARADYRPSEADHE